MAGSVESATAAARIYVTTATGALSTASSPVGGGVAVLEALAPHLAAAGEVTVLRPGASGATRSRDGVTWVDLPLEMLHGQPSDAVLHFGERAYARFALAWEGALRDYFVDVDPRGAVVVANDISEGPPFAWLKSRGFGLVALYHVVVADFFARQYLAGRVRGWLSAAGAARLWRLGERTGLTRLAPAIGRLVWAKEGESARWADACIVPSQPLADALAICYPGSGVEARTRVVPWGVVGPADPGLRERRAATLRRYGVEPGRFVLLMLSRLSPEKRVERLIDALAVLERTSPELADRLALVVAGAAAYMGGEAYVARVQARARRLRRVSVRFPGYVGGEAKWELLAAADLFCSVSHYEAYGLTIAQALASGTPVVATGHQGARATVGAAADVGWVVEEEPEAIAAAIVRAASMDLGGHRSRAAAWGRAHPFEAAGQAVVAAVGEALAASR